MGKRNRNRATSSPSVQSPTYDPPFIKILIAIIAAIATIIVAIIGYFGALNSTALPIEATKTAEAFHTSVAMTAQVLSLLNNQIPAFTPTPTATEALMPTLTPSSTSSLSSTETPTLMPSASPTLPLGSTLFDDTFIDNKNMWYTDQSYQIVGGKYKMGVSCPNSSDPSAPPGCGTYIKMPFAFPKNFRLELETTVVEVAAGASVVIGLQVRRNDDDFYRVHYFTTDGYYQMDAIFEQNTHRLIPITQTNLIVGDTGSTNKIGVQLKDFVLTPFINGKELPSVEDGNLQSAGDTYLVIIISRKHSATIQFDNLIVKAE